MPAYKHILTSLLLLTVAAAVCLDAAAETTDSTLAAPSTLTGAAADSLSAPAAESAADVVYPMSAERRAKLIAYSKLNNIWRFAGFFITLAVMSLILFTGLSARLRTWARVARRKFLVLWLFLALFVIADYLLNFPFHVYRGFLVEAKYGFMNQTFIAWLGEDLLGLAITIVVGIIPVWLLYLVIEKTRRWWLWFSAASIPFAVFVIVLVPVVISPLFNKFEPLQDKQLEAEILSLADEAGIEGSHVFQVNASKQSSKINAYVTGLFSTRRIVLYDTMIDNFTGDEIKFVMGHEMGHYLMHHIWKGLAVAIIFIAGGLWLSSRLIPPVIRRFQGRFGFNRLDDFASLPLIVIFLAILSFLFNPITNGCSRHMERQADRFAMDISGVSGETAATAFDKLSVFNLSDPDPHPAIEFWFYSHPALNKRISFVRNYRP
ncbi:MAG: M48 family metallopeptidase [Candidatus Zixiibacteriota bacterium]|nr:MAG: M48 family metallopeptidase [candidate division Zixibacteria bacterium]